MATLANFPLLNQNSDTHEANAPWDCVPTCIAASLTSLLGKSFDPGAIKDAVYGAGYVGGTDAARYVAYCAKEGVKLYQITGSPAALIAQAQALLSEGKPSIITIPDPYMPASSGWTHAEVFHADASGALTALDPYIGKDRTLSDAEWARLLQGGMLWVLEKLPPPVPEGVPEGWGWDHEKQELIASNGMRVKLGFCKWVLEHSWPAWDVPLEEEQGLNPLEESNPSLGAGTQQVFRATVLEWTPSRGVFVAWVGQELLYLRAARKKLYDYVVSQGA